jgi:hypothetical protein
MIRVHTQLPEVRLREGSVLAQSAREVEQLWPYLPAIVDVQAAALGLAAIASAISWAARWMDRAR